MVAKIDGSRTEVVTQPKPVLKTVAPVVRPTLADELSNGAGRALRVAAEKSLSARPFSATQSIAPVAGTFKVGAFGGLTPSGVTNLYAPGSTATPPVNGSILDNPVNYCPNTPPLSDADAASAADAVTAAVDGRDASKIADWLAAHPDPMVQRAFWAQWKGPIGEALDNTTNCSPEQKAAISASLDAAYKSGDVTDDDIKAMIGPAPSGLSDGPLGEIIGGTHDPALINTFCNAELAVTNGDFPWRDRAIANALAGMPADGMRAYLGQHPTLIHDLVNSTDSAGARCAAEVLGHLPPDMLQSWLHDPANADDYGKLISNINKEEQTIALDDDDSIPQTSTALGDLLKNAANIQPPTPEVTDLFTKAIDASKDNEASIQGLSALFVKDSAALTQALTADGNSGGPTVLAKFFAETLFNPDEQDASFDGGGKLTDAITNAIKTASNSLESQFGGSDQHFAGRMLGRLAASLEGAAAVTLKNYRDDVAGNQQKRDFFAGLIGKALGAAMPDVLGADFIVDQVSKRISDALLPDPSRPDTIRLRQVFADLFETQTSADDRAHGSNSDLTTDYDGAYAKAAIDIHDQLGINFDGTSAG